MSVTIPPARAAAGVIRANKSDMPSASATIDFISKHAIRSREPARGKAARHRRGRGQERTWPIGPQASAAHPQAAQLRSRATTIETDLFEVRTHGVPFISSFKDFLRLQGPVVQEPILYRNWTFADYFGGINPQVVVGAIQANTCTQSCGICGSDAHSESNSIHSSPQTNAWPDPIWTAKPTDLAGVLGKKAIGVRVLEAPPKSLTG